MRGALAAAAVVAVLVAAGCGDAGEPVETAPPPPPSGTGYFVGSENGIGASLDLLGDDPVSRAVDRALLGESGPTGVIPEVGIASIVNETAAGFARPRFVAILDNGRAVILVPAAEALRTARGPAARRARVLLRGVPRRVPPEGAAVAYLVLIDAAADAVDSVRMAAGPEPSIVLRARRR